LKQQKSPKMVANRRSKKVSAITSGREWIFYYEC
jgi:hypothetical protein